MNPPLIVQFSPRFLPLLGGPEIDISTIVSSLTGYEYSIVANALTGVVRHERLTINSDVWRVAPDDPFLSPPNWRASWKWRVFYGGIAEIRRQRAKIRLIRKLKPDLVHVRDIDGWNLLKIDNLLKIRLLERWARQLASFGNLGCRLLLTKHYSFPRDRTPSNYLSLERYLSGQFHFIQCVDRHIFAEATQTLSQSGAHIWFTPVYVDTEVFRPQPWEDRKDLIVGYVGRHDSDKGTNLLATLANQVVDGIGFEVALSGTRREINDFKSLLTKDGKTRMAIHENVPHNLLPAFFQNVDILLNPVETEGVSRATLEAMACGRPVIMTPLGDRGPVKDGRTGFLVESSPESMLRRLDDLRENRDGLIELGDRAHDAVEKTYGVPAAMARQREVYETVLRSGGG